MPKQPEKKLTKQFSAKPSHSRSASYGRNLNRLGRITSVDDMANARPKLNRSKSTESNLTRRNRSFTKLAQLHPLTRNSSHVNVNKAVLDLHHDQQDSSDEGGEDGEDGEDGNTKNEDLEEEEVDQFSEEEPAEPEPEPQQVLSYKAPPQFSHLSIPRESVLAGGGEEEQAVAEQDNKENGGQDPSIRLHGPSYERAGESKGTQKTANGDGANAKSSSDKDLGLYYQNMILSQSTGVVRAFGDKPFQNSFLPDDIAKANSHLQYIHSNDHISGSNLDNISKSTNSLRQFTISASVGKLGTSNETSSSMLSFKAGAGMTPLNNNMTANRDTPLGTPSNFNQFLKSSGSNIETRTQQKLWLQRENSLLDVSQMNNSINQSNPQIRREFERVSREFTNVRRFENPLKKAVKRANVATALKSPEDCSQNLKALNTDEIQAKLLKLWIKGSKPKRSQLHQALQQQQQYNPRNANMVLNQNIGGSSTGYVSSPLRSPNVAPPSTRAVDRAQNADANRRIDLAAMRMSEEAPKLV